FGIRPRASEANQPRNAQARISPPPPLKPDALRLDPPDEDEMLPPGEPASAAETISAGMARKMRTKIVQRRCLTGSSGSRMSIGYSPGSPTNPGYGLPMSARYAPRCA